MSSNLLIPSALAAGLALSTDQFDLADTIGFAQNKDFIAAVPPAGDALLDELPTIIDAEAADMIELAAEKKGTKLRTRTAPKARVGNKRKVVRPTKDLNADRLRTGDGKLDAGKIGGRNDVIQGRDRCCTIEAN